MAGFTNAIWFGLFCASFLLLLGAGIERGWFSYQAVVIGIIVFGVVYEAAPWFL